VRILFSWATLSLKPIRLERSWKGRGACGSASGTGSGVPFRSAGDYLWSASVDTRSRLEVLYERGVVRAQYSISEEQCDRVSEVNVKGILFTAQKALPLMRAGGSIILTGSITGPWERPSSACTARQRPLSGSLLGAGRRTRRTQGSGSM
jgi:hypothetical protein